MNFPKYKLAFPGKHKLIFNGKFMGQLNDDPYNPLGLPDYTIRLKYKDGVTPSFSKGTGTQVSQNPNIWDLTYTNNNWSTLLENDDDLLEIMGANSKYITSITRITQACDNLSSVALFDTSNVTAMYMSFWSDTKLSSIPQFNTTNVTNMYGAFCDTQIEEIPLLNTSNVENMNNLFFNCQKLKTIPQFNTTNVTSMAETFAGCLNLSSVPLLDTSKVTNMDRMFADCWHLSSTNLYTLSNVTSMSGMYYNCGSLTSIPLFDTSKVTNIASAFYNCNKVQGGALAIYQQANSQTVPPSSHSETFYKCGINTTQGAAELAQIPNDWK